MSKVVFLDIDGVLNVISQGRDEYGSLFHKHFEDNLRWVIEKTDAKIVISSTWRYAGLKQMQDMWAHRNLAGEVIDITPDCAQLLGSGLWQAAERGYEIQDWLDSHPEVTNYVIFDDDNDMLKRQWPHFVRTSKNNSHEDCIDDGYGLTLICAKMGVAVLNDNWSALLDSSSNRFESIKLNSL